MTPYTHSIFSTAFIAAFRMASFGDSFNCLSAGNAGAASITPIWASASSRRVNRGPTL